jgi:hypothetical protein
MTQIQTPTPAAELRERALRQLTKKRDLSGHLLVFVLVNSMIVTLWAVTSDGGFFWPIFPMFFWSVGLVMNVWDVWKGEPTEQQIAHEMRRWERHR